MPRVDDMHSVAPKPMRQSVAKVEARRSVAVLAAGVGEGSKEKPIDKNDPSTWTEEAEDQFRQQFTEDNRKQMMLGSAGLCLASLLTTGADFGVKMFAVNDSEGDMSLRVVVRSCMTTLPTCFFTLALFLRHRLTEAKHVQKTASAVYVLACIGLLVASAQDKQIADVPGTCFPILVTLSLGPIFRLLMPAVVGITILHFAFFVGYMFILQTYSSEKDAVYSLGMFAIAAIITIYACWNTERLQRVLTSQLIEAKKKQNELLRMYKNMEEENQKLLGAPGTTEKKVIWDTPVQDATNFLLKLSQDLPPDQAERIATVVKLLNTHDHRSAHLPKSVLDGVTTEGGGASAWAQQLGVAGAVPEKKPDDEKPDAAEGKSPTSPTASISEKDMSALTKRRTKNKRHAASHKFQQMLQAKELERTMQYNVARSFTPPEESAIRQYRQKVGRSVDVSMFHLNDLCKGQPLAHTLEEIFERHAWCEEFNVDRGVLHNFACAIEELYYGNPYHNCMHAADVCSSTEFLLSSSGIADCEGLSLEHMAAVVAAAVHDVRHPGFTNAFLINTSAPTAIAYNDKSVLENLHVATAFNVLGRAECDIFSKLRTDNYRKVRKLMIEMVLCTDLACHFETIGQANATLQQAAVPRRTSVSSSTPNVPARGGLTQQQKDFQKENVQLFLKLAIKCSDVGHAVKKWEMHDLWSQRVVQEFYEQGDLEKHLGLEPLPFMIRDTHKTAYSNNQKGFLNYMVSPLYDCFTSFNFKADHMMHLLQNLAKNVTMYDETLPPELPPPRPIPENVTDD